MARLVELVVRADNRSAINAFREISTAAERTNAATGRSAAATSKKIEGIGRAAGAVGRVVTGIGVGMATVGYLGVKSAVNYSASLERVRTNAGASQAEVTRMSKAVLDFAASGKAYAGPQALADALFHVESTGYRGAQAMQALTLADQASAMSGANLTDVTNAYLGVLNTTHASLSQMPQTMGILNAAVGQGNLTWQSFTDALGRGVVPAFRQVGAALPDTLAAISALTKMGIPASSAGAQLATSLHYLVKPSKEAQTYLSQIGIGKTQLASDLQHPHGLLVALTDLQQKLSALPGGIKGIAAGQVLASIFPAGRGRTMAMELQNLDTYQKTLQAITGTQGQWSAQVAAYAKTPSAKLHAAWAQIQADLTKFGQAITPLVVQWLPKLTGDLTAIVRWFTGLPSVVRSGFAAFTVGALVLGPALLGLERLLAMFKALRGVMYSMRGAGAAAAEGEAMATRGAAGAGAAGAAGAGAAGARGALAGPAGIAAAVAAYMGYQQLSKRHQKQVSSVAGGVLNKLLPFQFLGGVGNALLSGHPLGIADAFMKKTGIGWLASQAGNLASSLNPFGGARGGLVTSAGIRPVQHYALGGSVGMDTVPAWLAPGEYVLNRAQMAGLGAQGVSPTAVGTGGGFAGAELVASTPITIRLDGRVIAHDVVRQILRKAARGTAPVGGPLTTGAITAATPG